MAYDSKSHSIILWRMISVKLNIGFCASLTLMCLLPNTISKYILYNTMVSQDEVAGELFAKGSLSTLAEMLVCD